MGFSIKSLVSTSRLIEVDALQDSNHPVFVCTAYACRNWMPHLVFTFLPLFLLAFSLVMLGDILPQPHNPSSTYDLPDDYVTKSFILILTSCFFIFLSSKTINTNNQRDSFNLLGAYTILHCLLVLLLTIKTLSDANLRPLLSKFQLQIGGRDRWLNVDHVAVLLIFLCLNTVFYLGVAALLFVRYIRMKRKAKRLIKRQTDYKRLRSAREHSVQSFSNISKPSKLPRSRGNRPLSEPVQSPRPFSAAVLASEHAGAMPRSKWRLENPAYPSAPPGESDDDSSDNIVATSPDSQFPRSISFPTSSLRGLKEIPV